MTQNFVGRVELSAVLEFMRDRPAQLSGFARCSNATDETDDGLDAGKGVLEAFTDALERHGHADLVTSALRPAERRPRPLWTSMRDEASFSFGFELEE